MCPECVPEMLLGKTFLGKTGEPFRLGREPHGTESAAPPGCLVGPCQVDVV